MSKKVELLKPGAIKGKKFLTLFFSLLLPCVFYGQINFEKFNAGYYINNNNQKTVGIIRYVKGNRARIEYKETEGGKKRKKSTRRNAGNLHLIQVPDLSGVPGV